MTAQPTAGRRERVTTRVPGELPWFLSFPGYLAVLNVCALVASLLVVTAPAAAVAAQVTLHRWWDLEDTRIVGNFVRELRRQVPRLAVVGVAALALVALLAVAVGFWLGFPGPARLPVLACLGTLVVTLLTVWLAALEMVAHQPTERFRVWAKSVPAVVVAHPLRAAAAVIVLLTWFALLDSVPLLALGWGLVVPGMLARWAFHPVVTLAGTSDVDVFGGLE